MFSEGIFLRFLAYSGNDTTRYKEEFFYVSGASLYTIPVLKEHTQFIIKVFFNGMIITILENRISNTTRFLKKILILFLNRFFVYNIIAQKRIFTKVV